MNNRRTQVSLEYIIVIAVLMIFIAPITYFSFSTFGTASKVYNAEMVVTRLVESADSIYAQGWPSQQKISLLFPESVAGIIISNKTIALDVAIGDTNTTIIGTTKGCIMGDLATSSGLRNIVLRAESNTCVNITEAV